MQHRRADRAGPVRWARWCCAFGSPETFALALFALTVLAGLAEASFLKGLASGFVGLLLTTVGLDTLTGSLRFTFGRTELMTGVDVVAAMVGLFAIDGDVLPDRPSGREPGSS